MAREILKEVEACEQMMANLFPPAVRPQLQHYLNPKYDAAIDERTAERGDSNDMVCLHVKA